MFNRNERKINASGQNYRSAGTLQNKKEYCKYIASLLLFGSNGIVAGQIDLPSAEIVFWRTLIGSILLMAIYSIKNGGQTLTTAADIFSHRKDILYVILSGMSMGLSWIFLYEAYAIIGVSLSSLAYYCGPVIVMILSPVLFHEKLTPGIVTGFLIVFIGVCMTNGAISGSIDHSGILCGLGSAVTQALMIILNKKSREIKGFENSMIQLVCSFLTVMVYIGIRNGFALHVTAADWGWLIVLGLINTGFGCYLYFSSIGFLSVQSVAVLGYLEPLSAVVLAVIILKENMTISQWIGAALIIGGALLGETQKAFPR